MDEDIKDVMTEAEKQEIASKTDKPESDQATSEEVATEETPETTQEEAETEAVEDIAESTATEPEPQENSLDAKLDRVTDLLVSLVEALSPEGHYVEPKPIETPAEEAIEKDPTTEELDEVAEELDF